MSKRASLASIAALAIASAASGALAAQPAVAPPANLVTRPVWAKILDDMSLTLFYPDRARRGGITGYAIVGCEVTSEGSLADCAVVDEDPRGQAFGAALLKVSGHLKIGETDLDGQPTLGRPIRVAAQFGAVKGQRDADGAQVYGMNLYVVGR